MDELLEILKSLHQEAADEIRTAVFNGSNCDYDRGYAEACERIMGIIDHQKRAIEQEYEVDVEDIKATLDDLDLRLMEISNELDEIKGRL